MTHAPNGLSVALARGLYILAGVMLIPALAVHLIWRGLRQPAYWTHWSERFLGLAIPRGPHDGVTGHAFTDDPNRKVLWIHAVSVGETRAAAPMITSWLRKSAAHRVVLTHTTPTGRETGRTLFAADLAAQPPRFVQRYLPYDLLWANALFLSWARPTVGVLMETELWPNLIAQTKARGIPLALINARLSPRSARRLLAFRALAYPALHALRGIAAQAETDAQGFRAVLGESPRSAPYIVVMGNMKFDVTLPAEMRAQGAHWRTGCGGRRIWLAASTREDEEIGLLAAWGAAQASGGLTLRDTLLIVPRHPQRFDRVARLIDEAGWSCYRRSQWREDRAISDRDVLLGDSLGEMFAYLEMSDLVLIGGSIPPLGGQNPIEACAVGRPVFFGPHMFNFHQIAQALMACGAGREVGDARAWIAQGVALLSDASAYAERSALAQRFADTHRGATQRAEAFLDQFCE